MNSTDDLSNPLSGGGGDIASQASQRSGLSLLERIQAQRNREQQSAAAESSALSPNTPQQIQVPKYNPVPSNNANNDPSPPPTSGNLFSSAWNTISAGMEQGMASIPQPDQEFDGGTRDALLSPSSTHSDITGGDYSMSGYFLTFVRDMYGLFQSLPVWARWVVCLFLLYIAIKLL